MQSIAGSSPVYRSIKSNPTKVAFYCIYECSMHAGMTADIVGQARWELEAATAEIDAIANKKDGNIYSVTLGGGSKGYVTGGTIVTDEEGNIDENATREANEGGYLYIMQEGRVRTLVPEALVSLDNVESAEETKAMREAEINASFNARYEELTAPVPEAAPAPQTPAQETAPAEATAEASPTQTAAAPTAQAAPTASNEVAEDAARALGLSLDELNDAVKSEQQGLSIAANFEAGGDTDGANAIRAYVSERFGTQTVAAPTQGNNGAENITIQGNNGADKREQSTSSLDAMPSESNLGEANAPENITQAPENVAPAAIPVEKRGKEERQAFHLVPVERTTEELYNSGLDQREIDAFVLANIDEINGDIEKHNKKPPKMGANIAAYKAAKEQWQAEGEDLAARLSYYKGLQEHIKSITTSDAAEARQQQVVDERRAQMDYTARQLGFDTVDELIAYEETILPRIIEQYAGYDEQTYYNILDNDYTDNYDDTTRESETVGRGGEVQQGEEPVTARGIKPIGAGQQGGAILDNVQGSVEDAPAQAGEPVGETEELNQSGDNLEMGAHLTNEASKEKTIGRSLSEQEAQSLIVEMENNAEVAPDIELNIDNWDALFGEDGTVNTPIGEVKMGENQFTKLMRQDRNGKLGMIKPTLENPDAIIEDKSKAKEGDTTERASSYIFVKAFKKADGTRYYYFTSVTVSKDSKEVVISNQEKRRNAIANLLVNGKLVWKHADNVSSASDVANGLYSSQVDSSELATEGTDAPQTNGTINADVPSSEGESTTQSANSQENSVKSGENTQNRGEKNVIEEMREQNRVAEEREQRAGVPPRPSDYSSAINAEDTEAQKAWEDRFNDFLAKLTSEDLPTIDGTISSMQGNKDAIKAGDPGGYKENPNYKAFDYIEKALKKRKRELEQSSTNGEKSQEIEDNSTNGGEETAPNASQQGEPADIEINGETRADKATEEAVLKNYSLEPINTATKQMSSDGTFDIFQFDDLVEFAEEIGAVSPIKIEPKIMGGKMMTIASVAERGAINLEAAYRSGNRKKIERVEKEQSLLSDSLAEVQTIKDIEGGISYYKRKKEEYKDKPTAYRAFEFLENLSKKVLTKKKAELQRGSLSLDGENPAFRAATEKTMQALQKTGVEVVMATEEQVKAVMGVANAERQMIADANERFNRELQQQIDGTLPKGHIYQLGMPSAVLQSTGVPNLPVQLNSTKLQEKATSYGHDYNLEEIKDLVKALNNPMAVFAYGNKTKAQNIVVEIQSNGKNFVVGLALRPVVGGKALEINSIRNVFPKDNAEWLNWISQGKALYLDKEKIQTLISQQRTNLADVDYLDLDSVANVINNFENPKIEADFSRAAAPFYSNARKAVLDIKQEKATPEQWVAMLKKNGGLKAGEDAWVGLEAWLGEQQGTVTKQEILDYLAEHSIQIEEVEYAQFGYGLMDEAARNIEAEVKVIGWDAVQEKYPGVEDFFELDNGEILWSEEKADVGEYEDFIIDNGLVDVNPAANGINETRERYTTEGLERKREIALTVPTIEPYNQNDDVHFGDAGGGRAVAWVRFGETIDSEGKRVLVIDEIQSKRHQDGREKGYRGVGLAKDVLAAEEEVRKTNRELTAYREPLKEKYNFKGLGGSMSERLKNFDAMLSEEERTIMDALGKARNEAEKRLKELREQERGIPSAPFEKNWHELAMKRMLRLAAEEGFDKVAWTTGEQQARRYDMSRQVESISVEENTTEEFSDGTPVAKNIIISTANGMDIRIDADAEGVIHGGEYGGKHLSDVVDKEIAEKIMQPGSFKLEGDGLRIGGEGMKGFYDKMLPSFVQKYTKKWGAKVGEVTMPALKENNTMHSVDVTPEMREGVMQGQPMLLRTSDGTVYGWTVNGKIFLTPEGVNPNTPVHEYTHLWASAIEQRDPGLWAEVVEAMKLSPVWAEVMADETYRDIWNDENRTASEVLARLTGNENYRRTMQEAALKESDPTKKFGLIAAWGRVKRVLAKFWNRVREMLDLPVTGEPGNDVPAWERFVNSAIGDFYGGVNPNVENSPMERMTMGSRVDARMAQVASELDGRKLTTEQQAVADVFGGKADNLTISVKTRDGNERKVVMRQGNEANAGAKHSLYRHFGTGVGVITSDDIISIPNVIANGVRTEKRRGITRLAEYKLNDVNGGEFTVLTEIKKGKEIFNDFYSNKKAPLSGTFNTQSAHTANNNALSANKGNTNSSNTQNKNSKTLFRSVGGNSGYVGYSMSKRAAEAREEGRYPKTDFKKEYNVPQQTLEVLVEAGIIDNSEWHHTSKMGNRTTFYGWAEEDFAERYARNKKEIDKLVKEVNANIAKIEKEQRAFFESWKGYEFPETFDWDAYSRRARELEELPYNERKDILHSEFPETAEADKDDRRRSEFSDKFYKKKREQKKRLQDLLEERFFGEASNALFRLTSEKGAAEIDAKEGVTTRMDALELAKVMEARGYEGWEIEVATGWRQIKGGQWRYDLGKKRNNSKTDVSPKQRNELAKHRVEEIFGGIWIDDAEEFAKFASAVNNSPFEEDGEGIAFTDNYFYAYYLNIDGQVIPFASVYLNSPESQEVVNKYNQQTKEYGEQRRVREYIDRANAVARNIQSKRDAEFSIDKGASNPRRNDSVDSNISRKGRYYDRPSLYVKTQRADRFGIKDDYSRKGTEEEINPANVPISKALGKPRGTRKQRREFAQRERQRMAERVHTLAEKLHLEVEVVTDVSSLEGKKRRAKGFYFLKADLTAYYTRLDNAIVRRDYMFNGSSTMLYQGEVCRVQALQNVAVVRVWGVQGSLNAKFARDFYASARASYQHGREELDNGLTSPLRHAAQLFGRAAVGYDNKRFAVEAFTHFQAECSADDMPDRRYRPYSCGISAAGRNFTVSLNYSLF